MNTLVSIIMPVYNSEKTIKRAIDSLCVQTNKNIEIIIVDDHSIDNTNDIITSIANNDERVKVLKNNSKGVSSARNLGLNNARGAYVMFLDSDDEFKNNSTEKMLSLIEKNNVDLAICNYETVKVDSVYSNEKHSSYGLKDKKDYLIDDILDKHSLYYGAIWNKIFKLSIIKENNIRFKEDISLGEDTVFDCEYLKYVEKILVTEDILYRYHINSDISLTKQNDEIQMWLYLKETYVYLLELLKENNLLEEYKEQVSYIILTNMAIAIDSLNSVGDKNKYEKQLQEITSGEVVKYAINNGKLSMTEKIIKRYLNDKKFKQMRRALQIKNRL